MKKMFTLGFSLLCFLAMNISAQNVTVNPGAGSYATLKAAFDAINAGTHTGAITVTILANTTETVSAAINASGSGSANYSSIIINPAGTVTVSGSLAGALINLNGADNVTINGLNTGGNSLTISNTSTSASANTSTIRFISDATNNTITNCTILGSTSLAANSTTATGNILFSTGTTTGNDNNTISNNNISSAGSNLSSRGIASFGSSTATNSEIFITNNNIYDIFNATYSVGILANDNNINWLITNNRIYQTASRAGAGTGINYGIWIDGATVADNFTITGNMVGYASNTQTGVYTITGAATTFQGISYRGKTSGNVTNISNNTISSVNVGNTSTVVNYGINFTVAAAGGIPANISNNTVSSFTSPGNLYAIAFTGSGNSQASTMAGNTVTGIILTGIGRFYGILYNPGDGGVAGMISGNSITSVILNGTASGSATGSPALTGVYVASGPATVTNNTVGSQTTTSISCTQTTASTSSFDLLGIFVKGLDNISITNNMIGGLLADNTLATSGTPRIFGIRNSSAGIVTCSNNTIGGTTSNSIQINSTFAGTSVLGLYNNAGPLTFNANTIRNISSGAGTGTGANSAAAGIVNAANAAITISNNQVFNLSATGSSVAGIISSNGTLTNISANTVYNLSGTSVSATPYVAGIQITGGTTTNVFRNKLYNISQANAFTSTGGVNGINISGGSTVTAYNNLIGQLTAPAANSIDAIRGINVNSVTPSSSCNLYYNTVFINASSTGTNFGTTALFHASNATATTASLLIKCNIFINQSTPSGTGLTAVFRRWEGTASAASLANYATGSNVNIFYAGTPGSTRVIYSDSISVDETIATFQGRVLPREASVFSENTPFLSTNGNDATFLHINPVVATVAESRGMNISGITTDYDEDTRQGNAGYTGTGTAPDIGADEGNFNALVLPVTLSIFNGEKSASGNKLRWTTLTEINSDRFELERSIDGRNFRTIGSVASKATNGNSSLPISYSFDDLGPDKNSNFYRLKMIDKDGRSSYSRIIVLKGNNSHLIIASAYPNPALDILTIMLTAPGNSNVNFEVTDIHGRVVLKQSERVVMGDNMISLRVSGLVAGNYTLRAFGEDRNTTTVNFVKK